MEKILIIEDSDMMRLFLSNYFSKTYEVVAVKSPTKVLANLIDIQDCSLVLTDYQKKGSYEQIALASIQQKASWYNIPVIILTDSDKSDERIEALSMGAQDCISKPFNPMELSLRIGSHVAIQHKEVYRPVA